MVDPGAHVVGALTDGGRPALAGLSAVVVSLLQRGKVKSKFGPNKFGPNKFGPNKFGPNKFGPNKFGPNKFGIPTCTVDQPAGLASRSAVRFERTAALNGSRSPRLAVICAGVANCQSGRRETCRLCPCAVEHRLPPSGFGCMIISEPHRQNPTGQPGTEKSRANVAQGGSQWTSSRSR